MATASKISKADLQGIIESLSTPSGQVDPAFVKQFLGRMPVSELKPEQISDYAAMVDGFYDFIKHRKAGQPKIHVFNPDEQVHGWKSNHSVIEMVNDDMPFLVDSVVLALSKLNIAVHLILHPVMHIKRDQGGHFMAMAEASEPGELTESMIHLQVDRQTSPEVLARIQRRILRALKDVRLAVDDWQAMRHKALEIADELADSESGLEADEVEEARDFFQWLADDHFMFLGYREYEIVDSKEDQQRTLSAVDGSGLGLMQQTHRKSPDRPLGELGGEARGNNTQIYPIIITKTNGRSTVHRDGYMDYISILRFDDSGRVIGEKRIIGLLTSGAYIRRCQDTPLVRRKVEQVLKLSGLRLGSHAGKALLHILETLPRDELFQASSKDLLDLAIGILDLQERVQTRLFIRRERFGRFYSCMVFIPRDRFNTENREKVQQILKRALKGEKLDFAVQVGESKLARMHV
ncbi:MAG: NAD-glutamate dehydrogenase, partial [Pseudomonadota bacterium]